MDTILHISRSLGSGTRQMIVLLGNFLGTLFELWRRTFYSTSEYNPLSGWICCIQCCSSDVTVQPKDKFFLPMDNELVPLIISGRLCEYSIGSLLLGRCAPIRSVVPKFVTATGPYFYFREAL